MDRRLSRLLLYAGAVLLVIFTLGPFVLTLLASVTPEAALLSIPPHWFRYGFTLDNYRYIFTGQIPQSFIVRGDIRSMISEEIRQVPHSILNSARLAFVVMLLNVVLGAMAGYAFARLRFRGKAGVFNFILGSRLIPIVALAVPYYAIVQKLGLVDNSLSLILIDTVLTLPFTVLLLTATFRRVPKSIEEAALVDGLGPVQVLLRITGPLSAPGLVGVALFSFMLSYSEFLFALLLATRHETRVLSVTLASVSLNPDVSMGLLNAGIVIGVLPALLLIVPIWRFMVQGLAEGSETG